MSFAYAVTVLDPGGLGGAVDALLSLDLGAALADWSAVIDGIGVLDVALEVGNATGGRAEGAPTTCIATGTLPNGATLIEPSSVYTLRTGNHVAGAGSEITIHIDTGYLAQYLWLDPAPQQQTPVPRDRVDAVSVLRHEIGHGLGMAGFYLNSGTLAYGAEYETIFDTHVSVGADGQAWFDGPNAVAVWGGPVPLTSDSTTENIYHVGNRPGDALAGDLMNGVAFAPGQRYEISALDLAFVEDARLQAEPLPCFLDGTPIGTPHGEIPVEALRVGDQVLTASGRSAVITWIGRRRIDCRRHARPGLVGPVKVTAGAFGPGLPRRDIWLSPDHAVLWDGVLIPVQYLANAASVAWERRDVVCYFHVELAQHDILLASGLPVESYLDTGNRGQFANTRVPVLNPEFPVRSSGGCAPLRTWGPEVERARAHLAARLQPLGFVRHTEADLHVVAGARRLDPTRVRGRLHQFVLPAGTGPFSICSRSGIASRGGDLRPLGVCLGGMLVNNRLMPLETVAPGRGLHAPEQSGQGSWCWTDGHADLEIPPGLAPALLELLVLQTATFWAREATARRIVQVS